MKNLFTFSKILIANIVLLSTLTIGLSSCLKGTESTPTTPTQSAYLLVVNTSEVLSNQDIYINNTNVATGVGYTQGIPYFPVPVSSSVQGEFKTSGNSTSTATFTVSTALNGIYSAFLTDDKSVIVTTDAITTPPSGMMGIRFVNVSQGINAPVDVVVTGSATLATGLAYKTVSQYYNVDPSVSFAVKLSSSGATLFNIPSSFAAGHIYTIYFSGATATTATYHIITQV